MEAYHCNGCGHLPQFPGSRQRKYWITSCMHVICYDCLGGSVVDHKGTCPKCKTGCMMAEINQQASPDVKAVFMDPLAIITEALTKAEKISKFQRSQAKSFGNLLIQIREVHRKSVSENLSLKSKLEDAQREIVVERDNAQREIDELKKRIEIMDLELRERKTRNACEADTSGFPEIDRRGNMESRKSAASVSSLDSFSTTMFGFDNGQTQRGNANVQQSNNNSSKSWDLQFQFPSGSRRLTTPIRRTPTNDDLMMTPRSTTFTPSCFKQREMERGVPSRMFTSPSEQGSPKFAVPFGFGRKRPESNTPDITARLRSLRCSASTPKFQ